MLTTLQEGFEIPQDAEGGDVDLKSSFVRALGEANGTALYERVIKMNPQFGGQDVTRLGVSASRKSSHTWNH